MNVSRRTAELSLLAIDAVLRRTKHNGTAPPPDLVRAVRELHAAAAVSPSRQSLPPIPAATVTYLSTRQAALRLGVSNRTVERRASAGLIPASRLGKSWRIHWNEESTMASQTEPTEAPTQYRVTGELVTVRTGSLAGIVPGRGGYAFVSLYRGSLLPADVPEDAITRHLEQGLIEEVAA